MLSSQTSSTIISGRTIDLIYKLVDDFDNTSFTLKFLTTSIIMKVENENVSLINPNSLPNKNGTFYFKNVIIKIKPDQNFTLQVSVDYIDTITENQVTIKRNFDFYSRPCINGEIISLELTCERCQRFFYSLQIPFENILLSCLKCQDNALCLGGKLLIPNAGY